MTDLHDARAADSSPAATSSRPRLPAVILAILLVVLAVAAVVWGQDSRRPAANTIMGTAAPEGLLDHSDANGVEVGTRFTARADGAATGMRFWKGRNAVGGHTGTLWSSQGERLAGADFTEETDAGWQSADFTEAVRLQAGRTYVVSYHAPDGRYAVTENHTGASRSPALQIGPGFGVFSYGPAPRFPAETRESSYWVDVTFVPDATPRAAPGRTPSRPSNPGSSRPPSPSSNQPSSPMTYTYLGRSWPDPTTTGVPPGTELTRYTGPCTIVVANTVIDKKEVRCDDLRIFAKGVVITNSLVHNRIFVDDSANEGSVSVTDTTVELPDAPVTGIGDVDFTATRVEVTGGGRGIACYRNCTVEDSYVVGGFVDESGQHHMSGIRVNTNSTLIHNTIGCSAPDIAPDAGCSAAITGYPDSDPVSGNRILDNLILSESGGYCAYGGSTAGKAFSGFTRDITFTGNVWQKGTSGRSCRWGPITSFDVNAPGNLWADNRFDDGSVVVPAD
jgi:hypothetical protein